LSACLTGRCRRVPPVCPSPAPGFLHVHEPEAWSAPRKYHGPSEKQPGLCPRRGCGCGRRHAQGRNSDRRLSAASSPPSGRGRPGNPPRPITARPVGDRDLPFPLPPRPAWHLSPFAPSAPTCPGSRHQIPLPLHRGTPSAARVLSSARRRRTRTRTTLYILPLPALAFSLLLLLPLCCFRGTAAAKNRRRPATENNPPATSHSLALL
jgi:hypothetical protein